MKPSPYPYASVPEFRLQAYSNLSLLEAMTHIVNQIEKLTLASSSSNSTPTPSSTGLSEKEVKALGINIFGLQSNIGFIKKNPNRAKSYVNTLSMTTRKIKEFLDSKEVEVVGYTGEFLPLNVKVEILATEQDPNTQKAFVSDTIEPSIFYKGKLIHRAKVIVTEPS